MKAGTESALAGAMVPGEGYHDDRWTFAQGLIRDWHHAQLITGRQEKLLSEDLCARQQALKPKPPPSPPVLLASSDPDETEASAAGRSSPRRDSRPAVESVSVIEDLAVEDLGEVVENAAAGGLGGWRRQDLAWLNPEAILWFVGSLLVLTGSLYFTTAHWSTWMPATRSLVVLAGLTAYQLMFVGLGELVRRRSDRKRPSQILSAVALGLVPIIGFAGQMGLTTGASLWGVLGLGSGSILVAKMAAHRIDASAAKALTGAAAATLVSLGLWGVSTPYMVIISGVLGFLGVAASAWAMERRETFAGRWAGVTVLYWTASLMLGLWNATGGELAALAAPVALVGVVLSRVKHRGAAISIAVMGLSLVAMVLALTGPLTLVLGRVGVLVASALGTAALTKTAVHGQRKLPWGFALTTGLFVYYFIPAPFTAIILWFKQHAQHALGYGDQPLPVAFYGLTFLPYLVGVIGLSRRLAAGDHRVLARTGHDWLLVVSLGLVGLALTSWQDLRPSVFSLPIYAVGWTVFARGPRYRGLRHLAALAWFVFAFVLATWWFPQRAPLAQVLVVSITAGGWLVGAPRILGGGARSVRWHSGLGAAMASGLAFYYYGEGDLSAGGLAGSLGILALIFGKLAYDLQHRILAVASVAIASVALSPLMTSPAMGAWSYLLVAAGLTMGVAGIDRYARDSKKHVVLLHAGLAVAPLVVIAADGYGLGCDGLTVSLIWGVSSLLFAWIASASGITWWSLGAIIAGAVALGTLDVPRTVVSGLLLLETVGVAAFARLAANRDFRTGRGPSWSLPFQIGAALLLVPWAGWGGTAFQDPAVNLGLGGLMAGLAFVATGWQVLFLIAVCAGSAALGYGVVDGLGAGQGHLPLLVMALIGHGWWWLSKGCARLPLTSTWYQKRPSAKIPEVLAQIGVLLAVLLSIAGLMWMSSPAGLADLGVVAVGYSLTWHGIKFRNKPSVWNESLHAMHLPVVLALGSLAFGDGYRPVGLAFGAFLVGWRGCQTAVAARRELIVGWAHAAFLVALSATEFRVDGVWPMVIAGLWTGLWVRLLVQKPTVHRFSAAVLTALVTGVFASLWLGQFGGDPSFIVVTQGVWVSVVCALLSGGLHGLCRSLSFSSEQWASAAPWAQMWSQRLLALSAIGLVACGLLQPDMPTDTYLFQVLTAVAVGTSCGLVARRTQRVWFAVLAELILLGMWQQLRYRLTWLNEIPNIDAWSMLVGAFLFVGVHALARRGPRGAPFVVVSRYTALALPLLASVTAYVQSGQSASIFAVVAAAVYAWAGGVRVSKWAGPLAALTFNFATVLAWRSWEMTSFQLYVLPASASLLLLVQIYRRDLSTTAISRLRLVALTAAYLSGFVSVVAFDAPHHALVMAVVCIMGIGLGALMRIQSYLLLGTGFLVVDLATNLVRFGLTTSTAATVVLTGLGLAILTAMVLWSLHQVAIRTHWRRIQAEVQTWPL